MKIADLKINSKKRIKRVRVARGIGSGIGKTAGRGEKGQHSRSGAGKSPWFEGGQQRMTQRIPKSGFNNKIFRKEYQIVNVGFINEKFEDGAVVDKKAMFEKGCIKDIKKPVKILSEGDVTKKMKVSADKFSAKAAEKIKNSGGETEEVK
jgi:large subunit ribosomal protein L15